MSIFTVQECWSTRLSQHGIFSPTCMLIANLLHGDDDDGNQLIVADDSGKIVIILPRKHSEAESDQNPDRQHLIEYDTRLSIHDLKVGRFVPCEPGRNSLAVVHAQQVSVYRLVPISDSTIATNTTTDPTDATEEKFVYSAGATRIEDELYELILCHELKLQTDIFRAHVSIRPTESKGLDSLIIQSLDCRVHLCLGATVLSTKQLRGHHLLPGPMAVADCLRTLVTCSTTMHLEGYRLDHLSEAPGPPAIGGTTLPASWTIPLHEPVFIVSVACARDANTGVTSARFVVIGRYGVYVVSEDGQIISSRQLDLTPCQLCVYGLQEQQSDDPKAPTKTASVSWEPKFILTTEERNLLVFKGTQIVWSAQLPWSTLATSMATPRFHILSSIHSPSKRAPSIGTGWPAGLIAFLDPDGIVRLTYLGTNPTTHVTRSLNPVNAAGDRDGGKIVAAEHPQCLNIKQLESELEQLDAQIRARKQPESAGFLLSFGSQTHVPKVNLQARLREEGVRDSECDCPSHFIDVYLTYHIHTNPCELDPVYLVTNSCAPIRITPNYMNFPSTQMELGHSTVVKETVFKRFCSLSVDSDRSHALSERLPLDFTVRLVVGYSESPRNDSSLGLPRFVETSVTLPLNWFCRGEPVRKAQVTGRYRLTFDLAPELIAHEVRLHTVLYQLWPSADKGSTVYVTLRKSQDANPQDGDNDEEYGVYVLENLKKGQIRLQGNYPEMFGPMLEELLSELYRVRTESGMCTERNSLLTLCPSKSKDSRSGPKRITLEPSVLLDTVGPLCDYTFDYLGRHLESRLALATQVAANAVQARHFRAVQSHVLARIQDQVPISLNGFDTLLEGSLHKLIQGCQSVIDHARTQLTSGASVIAMLTLLRLLCRNCLARGETTATTGPIKNMTNTTGTRTTTTTDTCVKPCPDVNLLDPSRLLAIVEANESVEMIRGTDTLPETGESCGPDSECYIGLEEYLDLTFSRIISQAAEQEPAGTKQYSTALVPDINRLMQQLLSVLSIIASGGT